MDDFDKRKLTEVLLFILHETGGSDFYHTFKILYFAQAAHLAKWGLPIVADTFTALRYGPVPQTLYSWIKGLHAENSPLETEVRLAGEDAPNVLLPLRDYDASYISASEKAALKASVADNASLSFAQLLKKSHDEAWKKAHGRSGSKALSVVDMAEAAHAPAPVLEYLRDNLETQFALAL